MTFGQKIPEIEGAKFYFAPSTTLFCYVPAFISPLIKFSNWCPWILPISSPKFLREVCQNVPTPRTFKCTGRNCSISTASIYTSENTLHFSIKLQLSGETANRNVLFATLGMQRRGGAKALGQLRSKYRFHMIPRSFTIPFKLGDKLSDGRGRRLILFFFLPLKKATSKSWL